MEIQFLKDTPSPHGKVWPQDKVAIVSNELGRQLIEQGNAKEFVPVGELLAEALGKKKKRSTNKTKTH